MGNVLLEIKLIGRYELATTAATPEGHSKVLSALVLSFVLKIVCVNHMSSIYILPNFC